MAVEVARFIEETLANLPVNHPDRRILEKQAKELRRFNSRNTEAKGLPSADKLVVQEGKANRKFFGTEIAIPKPPQELFDVWQRAQKAGINSFEAHFLPDEKFTKDSAYPGWKAKPADWYWEQIKEGNVAEDAANLGGVWVLVDASQKPDYKDGKQLYRKDPFGRILENLRKEGRIAITTSFRDVPKSSRFAITPDEWEHHVCPALADILKVDVNQVRIPRWIEFNVLGNMHHPEWGQTTTWEWFHDKFEGDDRLIGGHSGRGGLADVSYDYHDGRDGGVGFRPLVVFPLKITLVTLENLVLV